jgi:hypothetical protein
VVWQTFKGDWVLVEHLASGMSCIRGVGNGSAVEPFACLNPTVCRSA